MQRLIKSSWKTLSYVKQSPFSELRAFSDTFLNGSNGEYIENLFNKWYNDPNSVPVTWDAYFKQVTKNGQFDFIPEPTQSLPDTQYAISLEVQRTKNNHFNIVIDRFIEAPQRSFQGSLTHKLVQIKGS